MTCSRFSSVRSANLNDEGGILMTRSRFSSAVSTNNHIEGGNSMTVFRSLSAVSEVIPAGFLKGGETIPTGTFHAEAKSLFRAWCI